MFDAATFEFTTVGLLASDYRLQTSDFGLQTSDFAKRGAEIVSRFASLSVLVVGDVMLDRFIVGRVTRISPEAPVPVVQFESEYVRLGGAANVAHNIASLGGRAMLVGIVGRDAAAGRLREAMAAARIADEGLVEDGSRPTTEKVRIVTERNQQVARVDYEHDADAADEVARRILEQVARVRSTAKVLLISDYLKGTITRAVAETVIALARAGEAVPVIVDPKIPHLVYYAGATLVTPNHHEAEAATHSRIRSDEDARTAAREFRTRTGCDGVLITRGEHGVWLSDAAFEGSAPAITREVADVTGAGDTVVATIALALAAGATTAEAAVLSTHAAGIAVGKFGPAIVTPDELLASVQGKRNVELT